jgi:predicted DsbA family dithiol-disulfide isomerase
MSAKPELLIEIYTDPGCPWCWIGHARLEETLQSQVFKEQIGKKMQPVVKLRPYILDTRLPGTDFDPPSDKYDVASSPFEQRHPPTKREYYSKK